MVLLQTFGVDKSFEQLKHADKETKEKVTFIENSNFKLPLESGSVDLITVGKEAHVHLFFIYIFIFMCEITRIFSPSSPLAYAN